MKSKEVWIKDISPENADKLAKAVRKGIDMKKQAWEGEPPKFKDTLMDAARRISLAHRLGCKHEGYEADALWLARQVINAERTSTDWRQDESEGKND